MVEQELVTEMTALVVDAAAARERPPTKRQRQAGHEIGIDEVRRFRIHVELRKDPAEDAELHAVTFLLLAKAAEAEADSRSDRGDVDGVAGALSGDASLLESHALVRRRKPRLLRVGQQRPEDVVLRKEDTGERCVRLTLPRIRVAAIDGRLFGSSVFR